MKREEIQQFINDGYHIIFGGVPVVVKGDLWEYLDNLDNDSGVLVLSELLAWSDEELEGVKR